MQLSKLAITMALLAIGGLALPTNGKYPKPSQFRKIY
jgi:hypothetical protein